MLVVAEHFIVSLINKYGKRPFSTTDGGGGTWYPQAFRFFLKLDHHTHTYTSIYSSYEKSLIERTMQYIKDRTMNECFDDYFPCNRKKNNCKLKHVKQWLNLFIIDQHNKEIIS